MSKLVSKVDVRDARAYVRNQHIGSDGRAQSSRIFDYIPAFFGAEEWNQKKKHEKDHIPHVWMHESATLSSYISRSATGWVCVLRTKNKVIDKKEVGFMQKKEAEAQIVTWMLQNQGDI